MNLMIISELWHKLLRLQKCVVLGVDLHVLILVILLLWTLLNRRRMALSLHIVFSLTFHYAPMKLIVRLIQEVMVAYIFINDTLTSYVIDVLIFLQDLVQVRRNRLRKLALNLQRVLAYKFVRAIFVNKHPTGFVKSQFLHFCR